MSVSLGEKFDRRPEYCRPTKADRLYDHISPELSCNECDYSRLVQWSARNTNNPMIHYGTVASRNQVMKNGTQRDIVARHLNVICFEMEAAGLLNILPCLPVHGICDYSAIGKEVKT
ncbi:hypothetical protein FOPG_15687 [Fusarium oxysporum f. sp. conglutinans race 2 54008]|uniref:Nucleoside phosphorylase domain-containing protein n=3 Tax=Fusarium oxysporum TaxID=5507 RepID=F9F1N9_FUSOF|nr:hypothetical protein FOXB_00313 [Fusarium oxysporum f. sp. conglutinans Fo5176]EXA30870.1 hypothetical protein FOVG_17793 [Fusarium oxysporum f. sp. pisi HDV247]EXL68237.1 hypothetical protein FOPG_15687 [Fusarium oxysporum f. sp. conglutinans race 2 54008]